MSTFDQMFPGRGTPRSRIQRALTGCSIGADDAIAWGPGDVRIRLVEAVRVAQRTAGRVGPAIFGSAWPEMRKEWGEAVEEAAAGRVQREAPRPSRGAAQEQIGRADAALRWQAQYLAHPELRLGRAALRLYLACRAARRPFRHACQQMGVNLRTAERAIADCCSVIAVRLIRAGTPLDEVSLQRHRDIAAGLPMPDEEAEDDEREEAA